MKWRIALLTGLALLASISVSWFARHREADIQEKANVSAAAALRGPLAVRATSAPSPGSGPALESDRQAPIAAIKNIEITEAETLSDLEYRLLPDNALGMEAARDVLESDGFERIASAISRRYAADADVVQAQALYALKLQALLARAGSKLTTFECGLGYCLGEVEGSLGAGGDAALADGIDAGAFASLPLALGPRPRHRFIFATDPAVRELQGVLGGQ
ncbi:MAG TPA: hypothetical protein VM687_05600 [Stenotrophomonas sp.]|nr:hypothetical protein [Stenotrophomonas sp.]